MNTKTTERVYTYAYALDPVTPSGIAAQLRRRPEIHVVPDSEIDEAAVAVVAVDEIGEEPLQVVRALRRNGTPRVVVVFRLDEPGLLPAIEARRHDAPDSA